MYVHIYYNVHTACIEQYLIAVEAEICNTLYSAYLLTLGVHAPEGYGSCPVCVSVSVCVCVCLSATLIWGLGLVEV